MCIYCGTTKYRKIYEQHYGTIPKDENGRTYDIHHLDGNHKNNTPENLKAVSIQEHYEIHYENGDYAACHRMSKRINLSPEEISRIGILAQKERVKNGIHNFLGGDIQKERVKNGTHHFLSGSIQSKSNKERWDNGTHALINSNEKRVHDGTHNFLGEKHNRERIENGTHNWIQNWECSFCGKKGKNQSLFFRWGHNDGECLKERNYTPKITDLRIYTWKNTYTEETVNLTRREFKRQFKLSDQSICDLIKKRKKIIKGWYLIFI